MSVVPPTAEPVGTAPVAVAEAASGRLGAGEAAVVIAVVAAVTLLAVLQRPIPMVLTMLAGAVGVLLAGRRAARVLAALAVGGRG
ncbi:hypothetical protein [Streptomyces longwoodensis]|uniref:hypothetical protein n=1 Tax=Streptomyces longwoodensis TaxID=68231 RepID=UPI0033CC8457